EVPEDGGSVVVTVNRVGGTDGIVTVDFTTSGGTANANTDYTETSGTLTFADGEASKTFSVPISNDSVAERTEQVNLTLSNPSGGAILGGTVTAELKIIDDEPSAFALSASSYDVSENAGTVTIDVLRLGVADGTA